MLNVVDRIIKKSNYKFDFIDLGGGMEFHIIKNQKL